jgi:hypothetical protein
MVSLTVFQEVVDHTRKSVSQGDIIGITRTIKLANVTVVGVDELSSFVLEPSS